MNNPKILIYTVSKIYMIIATLNNFYLIDEVRISGHDTGISKFNTLKNINIKVPMNRKLELTSVL